MASVVENAFVLFAFFILNFSHAQTPEEPRPQPSPSVIVKSETDPILEALSPLLVPAKDKKTLVRAASSFRVDQCQIPPDKWTRFLLLREPIVHSFEFKKGCDVEGKVKVTHQPFFVRLKTRNLKDITEVHALVGQKIQMDWLKPNMADLSVALTEGKLFSNQRDNPLEFSSTYELALGINGKVAKNKGGKLRVKKWNGKDPKFERPIFVE